MFQAVTVSWVRPSILPNRTEKSPPKIINTNKASEAGIKTTVSINTTKTLLCPSSRLQNLMLSVEDSEDSASDIAVQTASDLSVGLVFGLSFLNIRPRFSMLGHLADGDLTQGPAQ